jgi:4-alpha-glucanotransferase
MAELDVREWLLTNGLGSFASGTVCDAHTRTYHGWLVAAIAPPGERTLLLSHIDATVTVAGQSYDLGAHFWEDGAIAPMGYQWLQSFTIEPVPTWTWGTADWQLTRQLLMPYGLPDLEKPLGEALQKMSQPGLPDAEADGHPPAPTAGFLNQILVRYHWQGAASAQLTLRPLIGDRNFHTQQSGASELCFHGIVEPQRLILQSKQGQTSGTAWQLSWSRGHYHPQDQWYWGYRYPAETERGLGDREDLYNPGQLVAGLAPGESLTLEASVRSPRPTLSVRRAHHIAQTPPTDETFDQALQQEHQRLQRAIAPAPPVLATTAYPLLKAGEQFLAYRASIHGPTIIAGYPWFSDWGRDTLIALPGLAIATGRHSLAQGLLQTFGHYCQRGLIPNSFPDGSERPSYNSIDAALWWVETLGLYLEASQDWDFLREQYPIVRQIYKAFMAGTQFNIRVDALDGLVTWEYPGCALTWMDAVVQGDPITPRQGKAIEINALWYSALCWAKAWAERLQAMETAAPPPPRPALNGDAAIAPPNFAKNAYHYGQQAELVRQSLQRFWNPTTDYFYDLITPDDTRHAAIRPNAVIALSLSHCGFEPEHAQRALRIARDRLLTPYGLRSLDPRDPAYEGHYGGGMRARDRAYHQGTVWSWLIGPFIRAWLRWLPDEPLPWSPDALLTHLQDETCLGSISEIFDGDPPHAPRGAIAQAWSVAELLRHWPDLTPPSS